MKQKKRGTIAPNNRDSSIDSSMQQELPLYRLLQASIPCQADPDPTGLPNPPSAAETKIKGQARQSNSTEKAPYIGDLRRLIGSGGGSSPGDGSGELWFGPKRFINS